MLVYVCAVYICVCVCVCVCVCFVCVPIYVLLQLEEEKEEAAGRKFWSAKVIERQTAQPGSVRPVLTSSGAVSGFRFLGNRILMVSWALGTGITTTWAWCVRGV